MAINIIYDMSEETRIREMARLREKTFHDEASALGNARRKGKAEGRAEGRAEERAAMLARMRANGVSEEMIKSIVSDM